MTILTTRIRMPLKLAMLILIVGGAPRAFAQAAGPVRTDVQPELEQELDASIKQTLAVARYTLQNLALPPEGWQEFDVTVALASVDYTLNLRPHSVRAPGFFVVVQGADGTLRTVEPPAETTYRGTVAGVPDSFVTASLEDGRLSAIITLPGHVNPTWAIQPLSDIIDNVPPAGHVIYNAADTVPGNWFCGVSDRLGPEIAADLGVVPNAAGDNNGLLVCEVAFDADFEYYQLNGSSVSATATDINEIINLCSAIYERDCLVQLIVTSIIVRENEPDPYFRHDPFELMGEFRNEWRTNQTGVPRDIAHLFTGKDIAAASGGIIGLAFVDVLCSTDFGYGLSQSRFTTNLTSRVTLTAHEIGHNFSAGHCNQSGSQCSPCGIMCSGIGGCGGNMTIFGCSADVIFGAAFRSPCISGELSAPAWIVQFGTISSEEGRALIIDTEGAILIAGSTRGSLAAQNAGGTDVYVARYEPATGQLTGLQFGTPRGDEALDLVPDGTGGLLIAGFTLGNLGGANAGLADAFVARFDSVGQQLWIRQFGTRVRDEARALAPDGTGGVFIAGITDGHLSGRSAGGTDAFLARLDSDGNEVWISQFGTSGGELALALESDGAGGVLIAGTTTGDMAGPNAGGIDAFLARYDGAGNQLWVRQFGTVGGDEALALALDSTGGVLVAGSTTGSLGGTNAGGADAFVARYDTAGVQLSIFQIGTNRDDTVLAVEPDGAGGVVVAGHTRGAMGQPNLGLTDAYVARYDDTGEQLLVIQFGTRNNDAVLAMGVDGVGGVLVAGRTDGSLGAANAGGGDVFLAYLEGFVDSCPCACDFDTSTGAGVCDLIDFTTFAGLFATGDPCACDLDTSTGSGVCDLIDFTTFAGQFAAGCP